MNALEWHNSSELNIAVTPLVLLLGRRQDIREGRYDIQRVEGFLVEKGQAVEVYATTLHFTPCQISAGGFGCIVGLPLGTNLPLERKARDPLLFRKNKWLLAREENAAMLRNGARPGLYGKTIQMKGV